MFIHFLKRVKIEVFRQTEELDSGDQVSVSTLL